MATYTLEKTSELNLKKMFSIIETSGKPRDFFDIEGIDETDNIIILKKQNKFLYEKVIELDKRLKAVERRN